jgi:hypothetical protein
MHPRFHNTILPACGRRTLSLSSHLSTTVIGHFHILHESVARGKTVTPRQAVAISLGGLCVGAVVVAIACLLFLVPFSEAMIYYGIGGYFVLAFPWACLDRDSIRCVIRAHNWLVYFFIAFLIAILIVQWRTDGKPFPKWAVAALILGAVCSYSVMGYHAVVNFARWRRGAFPQPKR